MNVILYCTAMMTPGQNKKSLKCLTSQHEKLVCLGCSFGIYFNLTLCVLFLCSLFSWDNIYLWKRRRINYIQLASQWEAEHQDRPPDCWLQYLPEGWRSGQDWQCFWPGWLHDAAYSKSTQCAYLALVLCRS